jgi:hypothetical protein
MGDSGTNTEIAMSTHVVLNEFETGVVQACLQVIRTAAPSIKLTEYDSRLYHKVIDGVLEKIDFANRIQNPIIEG